MLDETRKIWILEVNLFILFIDLNQEFVGYGKSLHASHGQQQLYD
jgi:hypothetical protein